MRKLPSRPARILATPPLFFTLSLSLALGLFSAWLVLARPVQAATVTNCTEAGLRQAIATGGNISFDCGTEFKEITVTQPLTVTLSTTLDGGNKVAIRGSNTAIFHVQKDEDSVATTFTVKGLRIQDGFSTSQGAGIYSGPGTILNVSDSLFDNNIVTATVTTGGSTGGGAIFLDGATATINNTTFNANKALNGGAIRVELGDLTVTNSTFTFNNSFVSSSQGNGSGGGAICSTSSSLLIQGSRFSNNSASFQGGAFFIYNSNGSRVTNINNTQIDHNSAGFQPNSTIGFGGGIFNVRGQLNLTNSTLWANATTRQGGGLWTGDTAAVTISNATINENGASDSIGQGGGVFRSNGSLTVRSATIANNYAGGQGGGLNTNTQQVPTTDAFLGNTIVAYNAVGSGELYRNCSSALVNLGTNLQWPPKITSNQGDRACTEDANRNPTLLQADPLLYPIGDNGGPTLTMGLRPGSPALDAGDPAGCAEVPVNNKDQRGVARPIGPRCDMGAYEGVLIPPALSKSFQPASVERGDTTRLYFNLTNPNGAGTVSKGIEFNDTLPPNILAVSPLSTTTNCTSNGGAPINVTSALGGTVIGVAGVNLAGSQSCVITVLVRSLAGPGVSNNLIQVISSSGTGSLGITAKASLTTTLSGPTNLTAEPQPSGRAILLSWNDRSLGEDGFKLERSTGPNGPWIEIASLGLNVTTYTDSSPAINELSSYYYRVRAFFGSPPIYSDYSEVARANTPLAAPASFKATATSASTVELSWQDISGQESGYRLQRKIGLSGAWASFPDQPAGATGFNDSGLSGGTLYFYRLQAFKTPNLNSAFVGASAATRGAWIVTEPSDDGSGADGTLSKALNQAAGSNLKTITFDLPGDIHTVTLSGTLPPIPAGAFIGGSCSENGPGITLTASGQSGLRLTAPVTLYGLELSGFTSPTIKNLLVPSPGRNSLYCVRAK